MGEGARGLAAWAREQTPHRGIAQDIAPREASVLFHMGKIYKKLNMPDEVRACHRTLAF